MQIETHRRNLAKITASRSRPAGQHMSEREVPNAGQGMLPSDMRALVLDGVR